MDPAWGHSGQVLSRHLIVPLCMIITSLHMGLSPTYRSNVEMLIYSDGWVSISEKASEQFCNQVDVHTSLIMQAKSSSRCLWGCCRSSDDKVFIVLARAKPWAHFQPKIPVLVASASINFETADNKP